MAGAAAGGDRVGAARGAARRRPTASTRSGPSVPSAASALGARWWHLEVGEGQAEAVADLLREAGFARSRPGATWPDRADRLGRRRESRSSRSSATGRRGARRARTLHRRRRRRRLPGRRPLRPRLRPARRRRRSRASTGSRGATTASPPRSCTSRRWRCASWSRPRRRAPATAVGALLPGPVTLVVANPQRATRWPAARTRSGSASA